MPDEERGHRRLRRIGGWSVETLSIGVGVWVAAESLRDFRFAGSPAQRLTALALVTVVLVAVTGLVTIPLSRATARAARRNLIRMQDEPLDLDGSDWEFFAPFRRHAVFSVIGIAIRVVVIVVLGPLLLWASVRLGRDLDLPVRLTGFGTLVVASLVVYAIAAVCQGLLALATKTGRAGGSVRVIARYVLCLCGLWFAVAVLGGVRLDSGSGGRQSLALVVVAALILLTTGWFTLSLPVPGLVAVGVVVLNALRLWLVSWLSTWMEPTLGISGFWTFLLTALIISVLMWPAQDRSPRRSADTFVPPPQPMHQFPPFMP